MFWALLAIYAAVTVAGELLRPKLRDRSKAPAFEPPTTEQGAAIPAVFGTVRLAPNTVWLGAVEQVRMSKRVRAGLFSSTSQTLGYRYLVDMAGVLCHGVVEAIVDVIFDNTIALSGLSAGRIVSGYTTHTIGIVTFRIPTYATYAATSLPRSNPNPGSEGDVAFALALKTLYGGVDGGGGGVEGTVRVHMGWPVQTANAFMASKIATPAGAPLPRYPGLCYVVWEHVGLGTSPTPRPWEFVVRRYADAPGGGYMANYVDASGLIINGVRDANPAGILWECLTNRTWGLGVGEELLDRDSFNLVSLQLQGGADPAFPAIGMSLAVTGGDVQAAVDEVLRTIDGVLYRDPVTGRYALAVARGGYTIADLPAYAPDAGVLEVRGFTRRAWAAAVNQVEVTYTDPTAMFRRGSVTATHDAAVAAAGGALVKETIDFPAITQRVTAERLALRELRALSAELARLTVVLDRRAYALRPGALFTLTWPALGLDALVCRVTSVDWGTVADGRIVVEVTEDVFAAGATPYTVASDEPRTPPAGAGPLAPLVTPTTGQDATMGYVGLTVEDPAERVTVVAWQTQSGPGGVPSGWLADAGPAYATSVALVLDGPSTIAWRVSYTEADGSVETIEGEATFSLNPAPGQPGGVATLDPTSGTVPPAQLPSGTYIPVAEKGAASGVATLDGGGKIPAGQLPALAITETFVVASQAAMLALAAQTGDVAIRTDVTKSFILQGNDPTVLAHWVELTGGGSVGTGTGLVLALGATIQSDTAGAVLNAGETPHVVVPFAATLTGWRLDADVAGSITVEVWRSPEAGFPAWAKLSAAAPLTLAAVQENHAATLPGWTTAIAAGDRVKFIVTGVPTSVTQVMAALTLTRT